MPVENHRVLRVDNLLQWNAPHLGGNFIFVTVTEVSRLEFRVETEEGDRPSKEQYHQINPIIITPDWLLRCGGLKQDDTQHDLWSIGFFDFCFHQEYGLCQWDQEMDCVIMGTIHYKYVHQLQNLMLDLTGLQLLFRLK